MIVKLVDASQASNESAQDAERIRQKDAFDKSAAEWTIGLTVFLVIATVLQFAALLYQGYWLRKSVTIASEEFIASHRPEITIRAVEMLHPAKDHFRTNIAFTLENTGSSKAKIVQIREGLTFNDGKSLFDRNPPLELLNPFLPVVIEPGYDERFGFIFALDLSGTKTDEEQSVMLLELRILIFYEDSNGRRRQTSGHRQYDFTQCRFRRIEQSEFEYQT